MTSAVDRLLDEHTRPTNTSSSVAYAGWCVGVGLAAIAESVAQVAAALSQRTPHLPEPTGDWPLREEQR